MRLLAAQTEKGDLRAGNAKPNSWSPGRLWFPGRASRDETLDIPELEVSPRQPIESFRFKIK